MGNPELRNEVLDYLGAHQVMTLATNGSSGLWAAAVFYVNVQFRFYFLSAGHTRHAQNMAEHPQVAGTIQADQQQWQTIQGVQFAGEVFLLQGEERTAAIRYYSEKYPFMKTAVPAIRDALAKVNFYKLIPSRFYFIDNQKGFGHRDEIRFDWDNG
ncbi:MAG: pyridoxamine 5'-phosphate oxidase family protein [Anaerolineales bacterium]|nr:pyridoxamine 5'-phosphate oxidase family protein [Anaerolineales bacterium]